LTIRHAIGGAGWFLAGLAFALVPFAGVAILWWSDLDVLPSWTFLFGSGQLLLVILAIASAGIVDALRMGFAHHLPAYVRVAAAVCAVFLLLDLTLAAMWYGSLETPSKQSPNTLSYNPSHVLHGSVVFFALTALTALLVAALREGVSRR
jgi:hypothetical protein